MMYRCTMTFIFLLLIGHIWQTNPAPTLGIVAKNFSTYVIALLNFFESVNKVQKIYNGNILNAKNLTLIHYNKGSSNFENVTNPLENFLEVHAPSICMLSEANLRGFLSKKLSVS